MIKTLKLDRWVLRLGLDDGMTGESLEVVILMRVRIVSGIEALGEALAGHLRAQDYKVTFKERNCHSLEICYRPGLDLAEVTRLVEQIKPLLPSVSSKRMNGADLELRLGDAKGLDAWDLKIHCDSEQLSGRLRGKLEPLGFDEFNVEIEAQERNQLLYGGAPSFARQVVRWFLHQEGISVKEQKAWGDGDDDIWLHLRDPAFEGEGVKARIGMELRGDDYEALFAAQAWLKDRGFTRSDVRPLDPQERPRFALELGKLAQDPVAAEELRSAIESFLFRQRVDFSRYPLEVEEEGEGQPQILLPLGALRSGELYPYAGDDPIRWEITVRSDSKERAETIREMLNREGYQRVRLESLPFGSTGFRIAWGDAGRDRVGALIHAEVEQQMKELGALDHFFLVVDDSLKGSQIEIDLPTVGIRDGRLLKRIRARCKDFEFSFKSPKPPDYGSLVGELRKMDFKSFDTDTEADITAPLIKYGGAPPSLVQHIADLVFQRTEQRCRLERAWGTSDDDIWLYLPNKPTTIIEEPPMAVEPDAWFQDQDQIPRPLLSVESDRVRIGHVLLPRRQGLRTPMVPQRSAFEHYCLSQRSAETLLHLAESVSLGEPVLLEGETSVSKTSIIMYLAMLLNQPIARLNLNGQTDTGELVGRFVPQNGASALPVAPVELYERADELSPDSQRILQRAAGRDLSPLEVQQIMAEERMSPHPWVWQDGLVISAMRKGWWVVLDELNLAEPQILERLNSMLEREPSIVLTENDNSFIGNGGEPVHPDFRIFATMNPAEYAGRSPLSPAYRDRWRGHRFVTLPGEADYHAMLRFLVFGVQPDVVLRGRSYLGGQGRAPYPRLAEVPEIEGFLRALSRFQAALEGATGTGGRSAALGARRRERYVFSRRGLLSIIDYLNSSLAQEDPLYAMRVALLRTYLSRVSSEADRSVVIRLLDAAGIGPNTWELKANGDLSG